MLFRLLLKYYAHELWIVVLMFNCRRQARAHWNSQCVFESLAEDFLMNICWVTTFQYYVYIYGRNTNLKTLQRIETGINVITCLHCLSPRMYKVSYQVTFAKNTSVCVDSVQLPFRHQFYSSLFACVYMTSVNIKRNKWAATWQNQQSDSAPSEDSDQPGHAPSLIRVFAVRMKKAWVLSYPLSAQRRLWSDWADAWRKLGSLATH